MLHDLFFRLRTLMRRPAAENELDDELRFHLEGQIDKYGIWGIRSRQGLGTAWVVILAWCLLSGIVTLAKAFSFF